MRRIVTNPGLMTHDAASVRHYDSGMSTPDQIRQAILDRAAKLAAEGVTEWRSGQDQVKYDTVKSLLEADQLLQQGESKCGFVPV